MLTLFRRNLKHAFSSCRFYKCKSSEEESIILGWIQAVHQLKNKTFIKIQTGHSAEVNQAVLDNSKINQNLKRGCCVKVIGNIVESIGKGQAKEIQVLHYEILSRDSSLDNNDIDTHCNDRLFSTYNTGLRPDVSRKDLLHLRHRLDYFASMTRIRAQVKDIIRSYMKERFFIEVDPPHLTHVDCEGAGETFRAVIEGNHEILPPKLSVSAQFHLEALVLGLSQVYSLAPVFRANKSHTRHHLAEFIMLEVESVNIIDVDILCSEIEALVKYIIKKTEIQAESDLAIVKQSNIVSVDERKVFNDFLKITHSEAVRALGKEGDVDFSKAEEQQLISMFGGGPLFVTDFPATIKPFYSKIKDGQTMCVDLLLPGVGEVVGGSIREDDWECLRQRMRIVGVNEEDMEWYLDLRRGGGCPHGGFGLGFDRIVQFLTGVNHIQDVVTFPRTYDACTL